MTKESSPVGTVSRAFREDLNWPRATLLQIANFINTPKVQMLQFACSDGSESVSQAISLIETAGSNSSKFFPIQAMDINEDILNAAKSGFINLSRGDIFRMKNLGINFDKYFEKSNNILTLKKLQPLTVRNEDFNTYKINPAITEKINFQKADMFEVMKNHKDNSNTIVMCRNVLGYFSDDKIEEFLELLRTKLNKNSLVIIGRQEADLRLDRRLLTKDFAMLTENVLRKIH